MAEARRSPAASKAKILMPTPGPTSSAKKDGAAAVEIAAAIADIVVVVDGEGIVRDLKASPGVAIARDAEAWRGKRWIETVAPTAATRRRRC